MGKTSNDEAYERGVNDGKSGNIFDDAANSWGKVLDNTKEDEVYRKGYEYGADHRHDSSSDSSSNDSNASEACFLTTACTFAKGLSDDCKELQLLRQLRDNYILNLTSGEEQISEYYRISPLIVNTINAEDNSNQIFSLIYDELVLPSVDLIELGKNEEAFELYRNYIYKLKEVYL